MSFAKKLFSQKSKEKPNTCPEAIRSLKEQETLLTKKQEFLELKIEEAIQAARKQSATNKKAAIDSLKRKKKFEKQLQQIDGTLTAIEAQREALESANTNSEVMKGMKKASEAMKSNLKGMSADDVNKILDTLADQKDMAEEISDAFSTAFKLSEDFDESELERELLELERGDDLELPEVPLTDLDPKVSLKNKKKEVAA